MGWSFSTWMDFCVLWKIDFFVFFSMKVDSRRFSDKGAESGFTNFYVYFILAPILITIPKSASKTHYIII